MVEIRENLHARTLEAESYSNVASGPDEPKRVGAEQQVLQRLVGRYDALHRAAALYGAPGWCPLSWYGGRVAARTARRSR
ncbi:hypothetical protein ACFY71_29445 [Streptomyces cinerochromogenes]|uniref:hypothetical protein n=1 Tax=Streptomyces cinerochromogenes TaxID=66422 RepID=UPI0036AC1AEB